MAALVPVPQRPTLDMIEAAYPLVTAAAQLQPHKARALCESVYAAMIAMAPTPTQGGLTRLQGRVQQAIADVLDETGLSPTYQEISNRLKLRRRKDAFLVVKVLERKGVVRTTPRMQRSIELLVRPGQPIGKRP